VISHAQCVALLHVLCCLEEGYSVLHRRAVVYCVST